MAASVVTLTGMESDSLFRELDINGDGRITFLEMATRLSEQGMDDEKIEQLFFMIDTDHNGLISQHEFTRGYSTYRKRFDKDFVWEATQAEKAEALEEDLQHTAVCRITMYASWHQLAYRQQYSIRM